MTAYDIGTIILAALPVVTLLLILGAIRAKSDTAQAIVGIVAAFFFVITVMAALVRFSYPASAHGAGNMLLAMEYTVFVVVCFFILLAKTKVLR